MRRNYEGLVMEIVHAQDQINQLGITIKEKKAEFIEMAVSNRDFDLLQIRPEIFAAIRRGIQTRLVQKLGEEKY